MSDSESDSKHTKDFLPRLGETTADFNRHKKKARLLALAGRDNGQSFCIEDSVQIGRNRQCQVRADAPDISREHARIWQDLEGEWRIKDLNSFNGTWINGTRLEEETRLKFGDRVQIGGSQLYIFTHHDALEEQVQKLQKLDSLSQFAGELAHDFKNLLTIMTINVDLLRMSVTEDSPDREEQLGSLRDLKSTIERATDLSNRMLNFSRCEKKELLPINLSLLLQEVLISSRTIFEAGIEVKQEVQEDLTVMGDSTQLHQALMNLCINARDAMAGTGTFRVTARLELVSGMDIMEIPLASGGEYVIITVEDTGVGMSKEVQQQLFEPFFTTKSPGKGTGLGLATVFAVMKNHGGSVQVASEEGVGTCFRLYFPALMFE